MPYQATARKYRPQTFGDMVGQEPITTTLTNAIRNSRIGQAYLFAGIRGVGKTTAARILAKALNCERGPTPEPCNECTPCMEITAGTCMDVKEIDGASNRGIDSIRDLRDGIILAPARDRYKVYIIDEVHMLTQEAFNALLKTLEEPPPHVVFIFATTELNRVPATIVSRCQVFEFKRVPVDVLSTHLAGIAAREGVEVEPDALKLLARAAEGSVRDACSLLDQAVAFASERVTAQTVSEMTRAGGRGVVVACFRALVEGDLRSAMEAFLGAVDRGVLPRQFLRDLASTVADAAIVSILGRDGALERGLTEQEVRELTEITSTQDHLAALLSLLVDAADAAAMSRDPELLAVATLLRAGSLRSLADLTVLVERAEALAGLVGEPTGTVAQVTTANSVPQGETPAAPSSAGADSGREEGDHEGQTTGEPLPVQAHLGEPQPKQYAPANVKQAKKQEHIANDIMRHPTVARLLEIFEPVDVKPIRGETGEGLASRRR